MSNGIHQASLRDSEKKENKKDLPGPDAQVWIYTEPGVERKLATVLDPKMIDSRILHSITIPPHALFTARFNKADALEERRLREWPDDSKYGPDEYISVVKDEKWQWYYTEPKSYEEVWGRDLPDPGQKVWVYTKPGEMKPATVVDPKTIDSRILNKINIPPNALFTAWINENSEYVAVLKEENWVWHYTKSKKVVDLKELIQKEVDKQLDNNSHLERIKFQNEMIKKQKKEIKELKEMMIMERKCMQYEVDDAEQEISELKKEKKEMVGKLVKVQWVIEKIKDVKGFTETGDAIAETFDYIDFPEDEKEEFVASSFTNTVVVSSLQEDREFYGEDFHEIEEEDVQGQDVRRRRSPSPSPSPRRNLAELFDRVENRREQFRLRAWPTLGPDGIPMRDETRPPRWIQRYNVVDRYEDTSIIPDGPELPWYEARYPTIQEVDAARVIQEHYRSL